MVYSVYMSVYIEYVSSNVYMYMSVVPFNGLTSLARGIYAYVLRVVALRRTEYPRFLRQDHLKYVNILAHRMTTIKLI